MVSGTLYGTTASVLATAPNKNYKTNPKSTHLRRHPTNNANREGISLFDFPIENIDKRAQITSAFLRLYVYKGSGTYSYDWPSGTTLVVKPISANWNPSKVTYNTRPPTSSEQITHTTTSVTKTNQFVDIDITPFVQAGVAASEWYGVSVHLTAPQYANLRHAYGGTTSRRPQLIYSYTLTPPAPTNLSPGSLGSEQPTIVSTSKPTLMATVSVNDTDIITSDAKVQITSNFVAGVPVWSGVGFYESPWHVSNFPEVPLSLVTGAPTLATNTTYAWRMKVKGNGLESEWSSAAFINYAPLGTTTITSPSGTTFEDTTPDITWSFSGTQTAYEVLYTPVYAGAEDAINQRTTGKTSGTTQSVTLPEGLIKRVGDQLKIEVRVWDQFNREASYTTVTASPSYAKASKTVTFQHTTALAPVTDVVAREANISPKPDAMITWSSPAGSDFFEIYRDGEIVATNIVPEESLVSGTTYSFIDNTVPAIGLYTWSVSRKVGSQTSVPVSSSFRLDSDIAWLISEEDPDQFIPIASASPVDFQLVERGTNHEILNSAVPIRITEAIGGYAGSVEGHMCVECLKRKGHSTSHTPESLQRLFLTFRQGVGNRYRLRIGNVNIPVIIFNTNTAPVYGAGYGKVYSISFDFFQTSESTDVGMIGQN